MATRLPAQLSTNLLKLGAERRLVELQQEINVLFQLAPDAFASVTCPQLARIAAKKPPVPSNGIPAPKRKKNWSKKTLRSHSLRMKKLWREQRDKMMAGVKKGAENRTRP